MPEKPGFVLEEKLANSELVRIIRCLSKIERLEIMDALANKELPVHEIAALVGLDAFSVRLHLRELQNEGLIFSRTADGIKRIRVAIPEITGALDLIKAVASKKVPSHHIEGVDTGTS